MKIQTDSLPDFSGIPVCPAFAALGAGSDASSGSSSLPSPSPYQLPPPLFSFLPKRPVPCGKTSLTISTPLDRLGKPSGFRTGKPPCLLHPTFPQYRRGMGNFKCWTKRTGEILTVSDRDFLYGAIATEMSPLSEEEALKAQAVAAYYLLQPSAGTTGSQTHRFFNRGQTSP